MINTNPCSIIELLWSTFLLEKIRNPLWLSDDCCCHASHFFSVFVSLGELFYYSLPCILDLIHDFSDLYNGFNWHWHQHLQNSPRFSQWYLTPWGKLTVLGSFLMFGKCRESLMNYFKSIVNNNTFNLKGSFPKEMTS